MTMEQIPYFVNARLSRGIELKWVGDPEPKAFTSLYDSWSYIENLLILSKTVSILGTTLYMRIALTFTSIDSAVIIEIIRSEFEKF